MFQIHPWTGLAIGVVALLVGLSGSVIVFYRELYEWQEPKVKLSPGKPTLEIELLLQEARRLYPALEVTNVYLPTHEDQAVRLMTATPDSVRWPYLYLHPQTGELVGETVTREPFLDWAYRLHIYLLAGETGYTVNGVCAFLAAGMCLSGMILWWPGVMRWARALKVKLGASWKRVNYDLHSVVGFWSAVCLMLVFLTGAYFRFPEPFVAVVEAVTRSSAERTSPTVEPQDAARIPAAEALAIAEREIPGAMTTTIRMPTEPTDPYCVRRKREGDRLQLGSNFLYLDRYSGAVLTKQTSDGSRPLARTVLDWFGYIHFGTFGGVPTQIPWVFLGLTPGALFVTGFLMYWNRVLGKKWSRLHRPSPARDSVLRPVGMTTVSRRQ